MDKEPMEMILVCKKCGFPKYKCSLINKFADWDLKTDDTTTEYCECVEKQTTFVVTKIGPMQPITPEARRCAAEYGSNRYDSGLDRFAV